MTIARKADKIYMSDNIAMIERDQNGCAIGKTIITKIMEKIKKIIVLLIITSIVYGGYSTWKIYSEQKGIDEGDRVSLPVSEIDNNEASISRADTPETEEGNSTIDERDNQRVKDLGDIGFALDEYAKFNKNEYPVTEGYEKISDENSYIYKILRQDGYLKMSYKDPLSGAYFYGYRSDGKYYELTAAFEDMNDPRCKNVGNYCIYVLRKP